VVKFDKDGNFVLEFGRFGQGPGEFGYPVSLDIGKNDQIYILDPSNSRVAVFSSMGQRIAEFRIRGSGSGLLGRLAVDNRDRIYISFPYDGKLIDVYSREGKLIDSIGEFVNPGNDNSKVSYINMTIVDFDLQNNMYVLFLSHPIVRKYNPKYQLIYEKDISHLPDVQESLKVIKQKRKKARGAGVFGIFSDICVLPDGDYLIQSGRLYHFNTNGYPIRIIDSSGLKIARGNDASFLYIGMDQHKGWVVGKSYLPKL